jgi:hypothetical protein
VLLADARDEQGRAVLWLAALLTAPTLAGSPPSVDTPAPVGESATRDAALIIGNEAYQALPQVIYADKDARAFLQWLQDSRGLSKYRIKHAENLSSSDLSREVARIAGRVRSRGTLWIYFAGHGLSVGEAGERALLGVDASPIDPASSAVLIEDIVQQVLKKKRAWRVVVIVDAGFGNIGRDGLELVPGRVPPEPETLGAREGVIIWTADEALGGAPAWPESQHGLFTWLTLGALRGWADGALGDARDGRVTLDEAQTWVDSTAPALGYPTSPMHDTDATNLAWSIFQADDLEPGPDAITLRALSETARLRRFDDQESLLKAEAAAFWSQTMQAVQAGGPEGREALEGFIAEYGEKVLTVRWAVALPEVAEARTILANYAELLGALSQGQAACLENRLKTERLQTTRSQISRLLLVNAESAGDGEAWERLMARHLEEIDRSDPDMCFRYAIHLFRADIDSQEESLKWSSYALENKQRWEGDEFVKKVSGLYKLRAEAAAKLWQYAEGLYSREPNGENEEMAREYRGQAMDFAREWLDYARASGIETERAFNMCVAAAGTADFCKGL